MAKTILGFKTNVNLRIAIRVHAEQSARLRERNRRRRMSEARLLQMRRALDAQRREVIEGGELAQRERERRRVGQTEEEVVEDARGLPAGMPRKLNTIPLRIRELIKRR